MRSIAVLGIRGIEEGTLDKTSCSPKPWTEPQGRVKQKARRS